MTKPSETPQKTKPAPHVPQSASLPKVTVGLPTFNRPRALARLLDQLSEQTYSNLEILVSNNNPDDDASDAVCAKAAEKDARIRVHKQSENIGPARNHQFLLEKASSNYFLFLGDDDEIPKNYVEECMRVLLSDENIALVGAIGKRYLEDFYWYDYETWDNSGQKTFTRLKNLIQFAFKNHWVFEQYWYGVFIKNYHPATISRDFKSTIHRIFALAERGEIRLADGTYYKKHTTRNEIENHRRGVAYRRHKCLQAFSDDNELSVQQCLPICLQMSGIIATSQNLSALEKISLIALIAMKFITNSIPYEIKLFYSLSLEKLSFLRQALILMKHVGAILSSYPKSILRYCLTSRLLNGLSRMENIIIYGAASTGAKAFDYYTRTFHVVGFVDGDENLQRSGFKNKPVYKPGQLNALGVDRLIIASGRCEEIISSLPRLDRRTKVIRFTPDFIPIPILKVLAMFNIVVAAIIISQILFS